MRLSVVIPAYNEEQNIKTTIQELLPVIEKIPDIDNFRIIVIDDHSPDNTFDVVNNMRDSRISCIRLSRRMRSHVAIRAGLKEAKGDDAVLFIAADGQDDPECLGGMLKKWQSGAKVVWGLRKNRRGEPWHVRKPARLFYKILVWLGGAKGAKVDVSRGNFFLLDKLIVEAINSCPERNTSLFGLIVWLGFKQDSVEYDRRLRRFGKSNWNFISLFQLAKDWLITFSNLPLISIFTIGVFIVLAGILYAIYLLIAAVTGDGPQGWSIAIAAIVLLGGFQIMLIGIVGEYLWRSLDESRRRPLFFIEKRCN